MENKSSIIKSIKTKYKCDCGNEWESEIGIRQAVYTHEAIYCARCQEQMERVEITIVREVVEYWSKDHG